MVRDQAGALVLVIVVEGQLPARGVGQLEHRIQRRIQPPGVDLGHDRLAGLALETEDVPVARPIDAPVDDHRQRDRLGLGRLVVGLLLEASPAACPRRRARGWRPAPLAHGKRIDARPLGPGVHRQLGRRAGSSP